MELLPPIIVRQRWAALALVDALFNQLTPSSRAATYPRPCDASTPPVNRPGMSGDSSSWKGWGHVRWFIEE
ncbi:hypothetical protein FHI80_19895, partial [Mycobacterium orygis]